MTPSYADLARSALRGALETRLKAKTSFDAPVCVYDIAEKLGLEVKFHPGKTFGGMYAKEHATVLVPAERPFGRRAFTCAHELGHWYFGHGTKVDELHADEAVSSDPEERLANMYGGFLLMPHAAVKRAFNRRKLNVSSCNPTEFYRIACQLGVGYETLIGHLEWSLRSITPSLATQLRKTTPKEIRESLIGTGETNHFTFVDDEWERIAVDLEVGDRALLPDCKIVGASVRVTSKRIPNQVIVTAEEPGITQAHFAQSPHSVFIRVSRKQFTGRSTYRHLEESNE